MAATILPSDPSPFIQLARFFGVLAIGIILTRGVLMPLTARVLGQRMRNKKTAYSIENTAGVIGIVLTILVALQAGTFGNLLAVLGTVTAALTVAIGFGMRDQVANFMAGLFIQLDSPFVRDDFIATEKVQGTVKDIKLRETVIRTPSGTKEVVPNGHLATSPVENRTQDRATFSTVTVKTAPGHRERVADIFQQIAADHEEVLETPRPRVRHTELDDGKLVTEFIYAINDSGDVKRVRHQVVSGFTDAAVAAGLYDEPGENAG